MMNRHKRNNIAKNSSANEIQIKTTEKERDGLTELACQSINGIPQSSSSMSERPLNPHSKEPAASDTFSEPTTAMALTRMATMTTTPSYLPPEQ